MVLDLDCIAMALNFKRFLHGYPMLRSPHGNDYLTSSCKQVRNFPPPAEEFVGGGPCQIEVVLVFSL